MLYLLVNTCDLEFLTFQDLNFTDENEGHESL